MALMIGQKVKIRLNKYENIHPYLQEIMKGVGTIIGTSDGFQEVSFTGGHVYHITIDWLEVITNYQYEFDFMKE